MICTVVANDTDILILLIYHFKATMADMYMLMDTNTGKNKGPKIISIRSVHEKLGASVVGQLLVIHALSGCDTTSALYGLGKVSVFKKITSTAKLMEFVDIVGCPTASQSDVAAAGCKLLTVLYGGEVSNSLNKLRHSSYMNMCATSSTRPIPERLPPTENAAYYHCLRTHIQVVQWHTLSTDALKPQEWGWKVTDDGKYEPIPSSQEPGPEDLLKVIRCSCKLLSQCTSNNCTCRKNGLVCMSACGKCHGVDCSNTAPVVSYSSDDDICDDNDMSATQYD
jgi:hypothetical protein